MWTASDLFLRQRTICVALKTLRSSCSHQTSAYQCRIQTAEAPVRCQACMTGGSDHAIWSSGCDSSEPSFGRAYHKYSNSKRVTYCVHEARGRRRCVPGNMIPAAEFYEYHCICITVWLDCPHTHSNSAVWHLATPPPRPVLARSNWHR